MTSLAIRVSNDSLMDKDTITTNKNMSNVWRKGIVSCVCFKMSKQMKWDKKIGLQCFFVVVKVKSTMSTFVLSI